MLEIAKNIYWVGAKNFEDRNIHGYKTDSGTTYNAYLIVDEKITLIDAVKAPFKDEMIRRIKEIVSLDQIDYIVSLHGEPDHSGAIFDVYDQASKAVVVATALEHQTINLLFHRDYRKMIVKNGETLSLGNYTLDFVSIPMVHWPDSTVAYLKQEKILFSSDAFGQHLGTYERFDDEYSMDIIQREMKKYFANIVLPHTKPVGKALDTVGNLEINIIANAHGLMFRNPDNIKRIQELYASWSSKEDDGRAVIIYDTMWDTTKQMAYLISEVLEANNIPHRVYSVHEGVDHISDIMTEVMTAKYVFMGSPSYNASVLPTVAGMMSYIKGFNVQKIGMAFSSFGWASSAIQDMNEWMHSMEWDVMDSFDVKFCMSDDLIESFKQHVQDQLNK